MVAEEGEDGKQNVRQVNTQGGVTSVVAADPSSPQRQLDRRESGVSEYSVMDSESGGGKVSERCMCCSKLVVGPTVENILLIFSGIV